MHGNVLRGIYVASWLADVGGIVLVLVDVIAARRTVRNRFVERPGDVPRILQPAEISVDTIERFVAAQYLGWRSLAGAVLFALGATIGLVANLAAVS